MRPDRIKFSWKNFSADQIYLLPYIKRTVKEKKNLTFFSLKKYIYFPLIQSTSFKRAVISHFTFCQHNTRQMCILKKTAVLHKRGGVTHKIFFNFRKHWLTTMINHLSMRGSLPEESFDKTVSRCVQREAFPKKALGTETV